jgi:ATP-binding protein involved in chromosome partitioning
VNLALALNMARPGARVGVLDLDVFGPSVPRLMGLARADEPLLTSGARGRPA